MQGMKLRISSFVGVLLVLSLFSCGCYLFTPLSRVPRPADFLFKWTDPADGRFEKLELAPGNIYGMGLTYAQHLKETGSEFDPGAPPPVFRKDAIALNDTGSPVKIPGRAAIIAAADEIEQGLGEKIDEDFEQLHALLDYEAELAFVIMEDVDWGRIGDEEYAPAIGYFLANDLSARSIAILGEGKENKYDYWGASKSFPGFLPVGDRLWIPNEHKRDSMLEVVITTKINGILRQRQVTTDMMYTPREMLSFIHKEHPGRLPGKGDVVLTGTPSGVAMQIPWWKAWLADMLDLDRFAKLFFAVTSGKKSGRFLKAGDVIVVSGGMLGSISTEITE